MPELPDITVYIEALESRIVGQPLERTRIPKPFLLRSVDPPISAANGKLVLGVRRMGKRIVLELEDDLFLVIHLMIAGRLRWVPIGFPERHIDSYRGRFETARFALAGSG